MGTALPSLESLLVPGYNLDGGECPPSAHLCKRAALGLLEDIDLGADLEGRAQLDVHGTHEMFLFK